MKSVQPGWAKRVFSGPQWLTHPADFFELSLRYRDPNSCSDKLLNSQTINDIYGSMTDNWFSMVSEGELCCNLLKIAPFCFFTIQVQKGFFLFFNESICMFTFSCEKFTVLYHSQFFLWTSSSKWLKRAIKMNTSNGLSTLVLVLLE